MNVMFVPFTWYKTQQYIKYVVVQYLSENILYNISLTFIWRIPFVSTYMSQILTHEN
jgi:hypothetical protein